MIWYELKHQGMKDTTKLKLNKWPEIPVTNVFYLIIYTNMPVKLQIENVRTGVYRERVWELEFTDRK